jgi:hypothetical protein
MHGAARSQFTMIEYTAAPAKSSRWDGDLDDDMAIHAKAGW